MESHAAPTVGLELSSQNRDIAFGWARMAYTLDAITRAFPPAPARRAHGRHGNLAVQFSRHHRGLRRTVVRNDVDVVHAPTCPPLPAPASARAVVHTYGVDDENAVFAAVANALVDTRRDPVVIGINAASCAAAHEVVWADVAECQARR